VSQVYVKPAYRGRRLTRRMLRGAFRWFGSRGIKWASLYVMDDNRDAIDAWKKMGFGHVAHYMGRKI
jgi:ribosomal protein S18 acetylase RimI-like enzyme